jgi:uncharacterized protein
MLSALGLERAVAFDCSKAFLGVDYVICGNPQLLEAEANLEAAHGSTISDPDRVRDDQRRWIKEYGPN